MYLLFFILSFAYADPQDLRNLFEKTYTRDNTFCELGKEKTQIQIRSIESKTELDQQKYGEYIFYSSELSHKLMPLNQDNLGNYRLFHGVGTICSKSLAFRLTKDLVAILFLRENSPHRDQLSIQLFNTKSFSPEKAIDTDYQVDKVISTKDGFAFGTRYDRMGIESGKIKMGEIDYLYQDRDFGHWVQFTHAGARLSPAMSFEHFEFKSLFKDEKDFLLASGWDEKGNRFTKSILFVAVNHELKKECILLTETKMKLNGSEAGWRCR
jgi:hypothetical protein